MNPFLPLNRKFTAWLLLLSLFIYSCAGPLTFTQVGLEADEASIGFAVQVNDGKRGIVLFTLPQAMMSESSELAIRKRSAPTADSIASVERVENSRFLVHSRLGESDAASRASRPDLHDSDSPTSPTQPNVALVAFKSLFNGNQYAALEFPPESDSTPQVFAVYFDVPPTPALIGLGFVNSRDDLLILQDMVPFDVIAGDEPPMGMPTGVETTINSVVWGEALTLKQVRSLIRDHGYEIESKKGSVN